MGLIGFKDSTVYSDEALLSSGLSAVGFELDCTDSTTWRVELTRCCAIRFEFSTWEDTDATAIDKADAGGLDASCHQLTVAGPLVVDASTLILPMVVPDPLLLLLVLMPTMPGFQTRRNCCRVVTCEPTPISISIPTGCGDSSNKVKSNANK